MGMEMEGDEEGRNLGLSMSMVVIVDGEDIEAGCDVKPINLERRHGCRRLTLAAWRKASNRPRRCSTSERRAKAMTGKKIPRPFLPRAA